MTIDRPPSISGHVPSEHFITGIEIAFGKKYDVWEDWNDLEDMQGAPAAAFLNFTPSQHTLALNREPS